MFITSREKAIIELIIKTSGKHTAFSIASSLSVSVRTIQRDLKAVEKILERFGLRLQRNTDEGLIIEGRNEQIFRLIQYLTESHPVDQTPKERKLLLLLVLFEGEESYKIHGLATDLGVSITTLSAYLDELTEWLEPFHLEISRKRGVGVELKGSEQSKRKALANFFLMEFNEEIIESLFLLEKGENQQEKVLRYFQPAYIRAIDRLVNETMNNRYSRLADSDYIGFIVHIGITMQRTESGFYLEEQQYSSEKLGEESQVILVTKELETLFPPVAFTKEDTAYLTTILKGSKLQEAASVPYDSVVLGQMIKRVIQDVSFQLHIDLTNDFSLFQGLLAHMEPSLYRLKQQMGLFNPLTEEIKKKYPVLFLAVKNSVEKEFKEIKSFPDDETAFIVLHFGSALVMQEEEIALKALIVCPTGIGTSRMLASRIKKEIIEIDSVEIKSLKEIGQQENVHTFDVIISTVRLPLMHNEYILVNPLLSQEDITAIKIFLQKNVEHLTKNKKYKKSLSKEMQPEKSERPLTELLKELKNTQQSIEALMGHFCVYKPVHEKGYKHVIREMLEEAEAKSHISSTPIVLNALKEREKKGGLGIPNTGMGLFHCRSEHVHTLLFQISYLKKPCLIQGMDGNEMYMNSLLLMLAPEELSPREQEIMSLLSTSFIESSESIMIFSSADEENIQTKMESIFLDYLHTNLIKE